MCTASWRFDADGYELFFNRDESVRRGRARAPEHETFGALRGLAPRDADAGGTWLGVNERGLALALLNAWDLRSDPREPRSRGSLVRDLLASTSVAEVLARLAREDLARYRGFTLLALAPDEGASVRCWDGNVLVARPAVRPLASSSLDGGRAGSERRALYERLTQHAAEPERAALERFHASHEPERGPWSPCMHRAEAATVSASQVRVTAQEVALRYADGPPCERPFGDWLALPRCRRDE
jgi:hypothetical protein